MQIQPIRCPSSGRRLTPASRLYGILTPATTMSFALISCAPTHSVSAGQCYRPIYLTAICSENVCEKGEEQTAKSATPYTTAMTVPLRIAAIQHLHHPYAHVHTSPLLYFFTFIHSKRANVKLFSISKNQQSNI